MMRKFLLALAAAALAASAAAADLGGVPLKDYHAKALGPQAKCSVCHGVAVPTQRPSDKACIGCHQTMDKIKTKPNRFEKFPHASPHYGDTLECTVCHKEHRPSRALCNDCHVVEFPNLK